MKRAGKCVGKKAFAFEVQAEAQIIRSFVYGCNILGIYECPTCLDFHTTSKYDNRSNELKKQCIKVKNKFFYIQPNERAVYLNRVVMRHTHTLKPQKEKEKRLPPNPNSKNSEKKRRKAEYKKSIVPLVDQKRILASIDNKKLSTRKSFWSRLRGIIKVNRI